MSAADGDDDDSSLVNQYSYNVLASTYPCIRVMHEVCRPQCPGFLQSAVPKPPILRNLEMSGVSILLILKPLFRIAFLPSHPPFHNFGSRIIGLLIQKLISSLVVPQSKLTLFHHLGFKLYLNQAIQPSRRPKMATTTAQQHNSGQLDGNKEYNPSSNSSNGVPNHLNRPMTHEEHETAKAAARFGYGPLAHINASEAGRLPAFGGEFQPGTYKSVTERKFANPAPLGLSAFALTTFVLSLINVGTRGIPAPNIVVGIAFGYGGLIQLLAGMWYVLDRSIILLFCYMDMDRAGRKLM